MKYGNLDTETLLNMTLSDSLEVTIRRSGMSRGGVAEALGVPPNVMNRFTSPNDDYWPSLHNAVEMMRISGCQVLLDWMSVQAGVGAGPKFEDLDCQEFVLSMGRLFRELGELARTGEHAVQDGVISQIEARRLTRNLFNLTGEASRLIRDLRPLAGREADHE